MTCQRLLEKGDQQNIPNSKEETSETKIAIAGHVLCVSYLLCPLLEVLSGDKPPEAATMQQHQQQQQQQQPRGRVFDIPFPDNFVPLTSTVSRQLCKHQQIHKLLIDCFLRSLMHHAFQQQCLLSGLHRQDL